MIYIFNREETLLEVLGTDDYADINYKKNINGSFELSFRTTKKENIKRFNKVGIYLDDKFQLFYLDDFTSTKSFKEDIVEVICLADFYNLANHIIEDKRIVDGQITLALEKALEGTNYNIGIVEQFENKNINYYFINSLQALNEIFKIYECEFDVRYIINSNNIISKFIDIKHRLGEDTGLRFTYDTALDTVEKSILNIGHFNVLYGRGKALETENGGFSRKLDFAEINNGKKYIEDLESINKYGRLEGIYENGNIEDKQLLLNATTERLKETKDPKFSYKATVKDISNLVGLEHYKVNLGDSIIILDEEINDIIEARIIEINKTEFNTILLLGSYMPALIDEDLETEIGNIKDSIDKVENEKINDNKYPDKLPAVPIVNANGLFATVDLSWSFENKLYYTYEVFASRQKDFNPSIFDRIFEGKASSFLHEVKPSESWYYRCRAKNTHGKYTDFSTQVEAHTLKLSDAAEYFEEAAIGHALIKDLDADKITVGFLKGNRIDARNLSVTDANGKRTLDIDSFGNITLLPTNFKLLVAGKEEEVVAQSALNTTIDNVKIYAELVSKAESELAQVEAEAYADGIVSAEEQARIDEAKNNLATAIQAAKDAEINANNHTNSEIKTVDKKIVDMNIDIEGVSIKVSKQEEQIISIDDQVKEKITVVEAESLIDQKADNILLQTSKSGGGNLFNESGFAAGKNSWADYAYNWGQPANKIEIWSDVNEWILEGTKALVVNSGLCDGAELGLQQIIKVKQNQNYTLNCLMATHSANGGFHIYDIDSFDWIANGTILQNENFYGGKDIRRWKNIKVTFNSGNRSTIGVRFRMTKSEGDGYVFMTQPMLNEGSLSQPWIEKTLDSANIVSSINVSPESVKIKSKKIQLEGTVTAGTNGRQVKINNGDYSVIIDEIEKMFIGSRDFENNYRVPKVYMGADGFNVNEDNYFGMTAYRGNGDNPENSSYAYQDLSYRCINPHFKDWSNIKMYANGRVRISPVEHLEITTNYLKGNYQGTAERRLALFATENQAYFNSHLQIGCIRNMSNEMGMILADDSVPGAETRVRCHTDSNRQKFFRVCDNVGDIGLGSTSFPWKNVVAKTNLIVDNLIVNPTKTSIMTSENTLDNIDFIQTMNIDEAIKMDVSKIVGSNYAPRVSDGESNDIAIDTVELLKLALMEIKKLKERIEILEAR